MEKINLIEVIENHYHSHLKNRLYGTLNALLIGLLFVVIFAWLYFDREVSLLNIELKHIKSFVENNIFILSFGLFSAWNMAVLGLIEWPNANQAVRRSKAYLKLQNRGEKTDEQLFKEINELFGVY